MNIGQHLAVDKIEIIKKKTKPPPRYTEESLLEAMCNVHLTVKDADLRNILSETKGLGTERTRADMIDKNIKEDYLQLDGRHIVPTEKTRALMPYIVNDLKDPILTAKWESVLKKIAEGKVPPEKFMEAQKGIVKDLVEKILNLSIQSSALEPLRTSVEPIVGHGKSCPTCGKGVLMTRVNKKSNKAFLGCSLFQSDGCKFYSEDEVH